nr:MFS transporter [Caballeronia sordidicola]
MRDISLDDAASSTSSTSSTLAPNAPQITSQQGGRAVLAAIIGNWLEVFDFTVYGFFAVTIGKLYFPATDPTTSLLLSVATFAVGFFTRPLGSVLLGVYADRHGRKAALNLTIALMALSTLAIACTPTYAQIGIAAPLIVVIGRLLQGFSQGGEFGAATTTLVELGSNTRRGLRASWQLSSQGGAALLGAGTATLLTTFISTDAMGIWGWRIPFLMGALIAPIGIYLRRVMPDDSADNCMHVGPSVLLEVLQHKKTVLLVMLTVMGGTVSTYILTFYMPTYAVHSLGMPQNLSMRIGVGSGLTLLLSAPLFGAWSDRIGRRKTPIIVGRLMLAIALWPAFWLFNCFPVLPVVIPLMVFMLLCYSMGSATEFALMSESFPRRIRVTGISIAYALAVTLFGGTAQLVVTALIRMTGSNLAPAGYVSASLLISLIAVTKLKETANTPLD